MGEEKVYQHDEGFYAHQLGTSAGVVAIGQVRLEDGHIRSAAPSLSPSRQEKSANCSTALHRLTAR
jgi:hypothetical protein